MNAANMLKRVNQSISRHNWGISELTTRAALFQQIAFATDSTDEEIEYGAMWAEAYYTALRGMKAA